MLKINEEKSIPVKMKVQGEDGRTPYVYLNKDLEKLGVKITPGEDLGLRVDRENKIAYFRYEEVVS